MVFVQQTNRNTANTIVSILVAKPDAGGDGDGLGGVGRVEGQDGLLVVLRHQGGQGDTMGSERCSWCAKNMTILLIKAPFD